jgi:hypothetical protein
MGTRCRQGEVRRTNLRLSPDGLTPFAGRGRSSASPLFRMLPPDSIAAATLGKREQQGALLVEMALLQDKERPHKQHGRGECREGPQRLDRSVLRSVIRAVELVHHRVGTHSKWDSVS